MLDFEVMQVLMGGGRGVVLGRSYDVGERAQDRLCGEGKGVPGLLQGVLDRQDLKKKFRFFFNP